MKLKLIKEVEQTGHISVEETNTAVVGEVPTRHLSLKVPNRRSLGVLLICLVVLGIVGAGFYQLASGQYIFKAGDVRLTRSQYNALVKGATTKGVKTADAKHYVDSLLYRKAAAHKLGVKVANEQHAKPDSWPALQTYDSNLNLQLQRQQKGGYEGGVVFFPFDRLFITTIVGFPTPAGFGDLQVIQTAQQKAFKRATEVHDSLVVGKTTITQQVTALSKDQDYLFAGSGNDSRLFSVDTLGNNSQNPSGDRLQQLLLNDLRVLKKPGVSNVLSMLRSFNGNPPFGLSNPTVSAYYLVDLTSVSKPDATIQQRFNAAVKALQERS